jgi:peptidoglycan/xylan/chitin deacetylase (PgdA/CDA1 family)
MNRSRGICRFVLIAVALVAIALCVSSCSSSRTTDQVADSPPAKPAPVEKEPAAEKATPPAEDTTAVQNDVAEAQTQAQTPAPKDDATQEEPTTRASKDTSNASANRKASPTHKRYAGYPGEVAYVKGSNKIALTFDAGASAAPTPDILKALKDADLKVTFFLTGKWCEKEPELVKRIAAEGHEIANHSYSHPDFRKISDSAIAEQLNKTENIIVKLTGNSTKPFFRPPYGGRDKRVLSVAGNQGYTSIYWSLDSWDAFKKGITSQQIRDRILERIQGGDIVLMHCGSAPTAKQLPELIEKLHQRGFTIVKVSELVASN